MLNMAHWIGLSAAAWLICSGCLSIRQSASERPIAADFYVATNGNDGWSGTLSEPNTAATDGPFSTLARARDAARDARASGTMVGGSTIMIRAGVYEFSETLVLEEQDGGTPTNPAMWQAYPGETVQLSGGPALPPTAFGPITDADDLARLADDVRGQIMQVDLTALGITDLGRFPVTFRGAPEVPELFINDQPMELARWPDTGWTTIPNIIAAGSCPRQGDTAREPGIFEYSGERPARWNVAAGVWLHGYYCFDWYAEVIKVRAIDTEKRQITLDTSAHYSVRQGNPSPRRYYALNLLEELTRPGEYYIDREAGRLYVLPPTDLTGARIVLSTLNGPVIRLHDTTNIILRGFTVEATLANGIDINGGTGNRIEACQIRNTRQLGVRVNGGTQHTVEACDIHHTGSGGITLIGGNRRNLTRGGHQAENNHIWAFSRNQRSHAYALTLEGVGHQASHNLLHDAPHQAIFIHGNDHVFEYNVVHHVCTETDDCGAYYKGRDPSCRGNIVRYNFWHNIGSPMGHGNAAVYFDDGDGGDAVIGNIFYRCGDPGKGSFGTVFSHGGHDIVAENNIFIECKRALGSAPWSDTRWKDTINAELWQTRLLKDVDITQPPYTTRYPALVGFMDPQPGQKRVSYATNNVMVMGADVKSGNWQVSEEDNWITNQDPGFVDAARGDFRLRPDADVFLRLPRFKPIPFEAMGLRADALRPNPPTEAWPYTPPKPLKPELIHRPTTQDMAAPRPVFKVNRSTDPIVIDGTIASAEWGKTVDANTMLLARDVWGNEASRQSRAWLVYDDKGLYIAVDNSVRPDTQLTGNRWGEDDAVEISLRGGSQAPSRPIVVIRGFANGSLQCGTTPNGDANVTPMDPGHVRFEAASPVPGRWTAECYIPFQLLGVDQARHNPIAFNLSVRKTRDDLWLMWKGTRAHSYAVDRAGTLELEP